MPDADLKTLLADVETIAIVGMSSNESRPSNEVGAFLMGQGYECVGVSPKEAGQTIHGMPVFASLAEIDRPIDMVDIFRAADAVDGIVEETLTLEPRPRVVWMQLGVVNQAAKKRAETAGLTVVMDRCPKIVLGGH